MKKIVLTVFMISCLLVSPSVYAACLDECGSPPPCPPYSGPYDCWDRVVGSAYVGGTCSAMESQGYRCNNCYQWSKTCVAGSTLCWDVICAWCKCTSPTIIELLSFSAEPKAGEIVLSWSTESEIDTAGFNLYRSAQQNGEYIKMNSSLIPAKGSSTQGASYQFIDNNVRNRKTYYYKLEDIDMNGASTMHGPVSATPRWIYGIGK